MTSKIVLLTLNYNDAETVKKYIQQVSAYRFASIVIVDNCSTDDSFRQLQSLANTKTVVIRSDKNGGYGYGNNFGINYILEHFPDTTHILISNPDVQYEETILEPLLQVFQADNKVAVVAPFMKDRNGRKSKSAAWKIPSILQYILSAEFYYNKHALINRYPHLTCETGFAKEVDCVVGSLLMVDAAKMKQYGMYDENIFLYGEETCLGIKLKKAGLKTMLLLQACYLHLHGVSIKKEFPSMIATRKLLMKSRLYLLQHYFHASRLSLCLAKLVFYVSFLECGLYSLFLKIKKIFKGF